LSNFFFPLNQSTFFEFLSFCFGVGPRCSWCDAHTGWPMVRCPCFDARNLLPVARRPCFDCQYVHDQPMPMLRCPMPVRCHVLTATARIIRCPSFGDNVHCPWSDAVVRCPCSDARALMRMLRCPCSDARSAMPMFRLPVPAIIQYL